MRTRIIKLRKLQIFKISKREFEKKPRLKYMVGLRDIERLVVVLIQIYKQ